MRKLIWNTLFVPPATVVAVCIFAVGLLMDCAAEISRWASDGAYALLAWMTEQITHLRTKFLS